MRIARTLNELHAARAGLGKVGLVPTMGALHKGHLALVAAAKADGLAVAASIFVNPTQFAPSDDFAQYPRDEAGDLAKLEAAGCELVWLPDVETMYPPLGASTIQVKGPAERWEGAARPGHFAGVATVVAKLFGQIRPDAAYFGEKDWQQAQVVSRMVADLHLPVRIVPVPTVREASGLALSSRNAYLTADEHQAAPLLNAVLRKAATQIQDGVAPATAVHEARQTLTQANFTPDYLELVHAQTLEPLTTLTHPARLIAAAKLGHVRLLDNVPIS